MFDSAAIGMVLVSADGQGRVLDMNQATAQMFGYERSELLGRNFLALTHPEDRAATKQLYCQLVAGERGAYQHEKRSIHRSGRVVWVRHSVSLTACRQAREVIILAEDITARKQTEQALRRSEEHRRLALTAGRVATWEWDVASDAMLGSIGMERMLGIAGERSIKTFAAFLERIHPDDRAMLKEQVGQSIDQRRLLAATFRVIREDGEVRWLKARGQMISVDEAAATRVAGTIVDITNQRRASEDQARLAAIVYSSEDAILGKSLDGRITNWNRGAEAIYGYKADEIVGKPASVLLPPERAEEATRLLEHVSRGEHVAPFETVRVCRDGRRVEVFLSVSPIKDEAGKVVGVSSIARDLREQIRTRQAMRESEERLELALWGSALGLWDRNVQTGRLVFNEQWANMLGYDHEDIAPHTDAWRQLIHPADLERVSAALEAHLAGERAVYEVEHRLRTKDGQWRWVLSRGRITAWSPSGAPLRMTGTHLDITERKQAEHALRESEESFRQLAANVHEVLWMADADLQQIIYVSPAYAQVWGRAIESLYEDGRSWIETVHPDDRVNVEKTFGNGPIEARVEMEYRIIRPDGTMRWIHDRATPIRDQDGRVYRVAGVAEDITEQRRAEDELHQRQEQIAHISRLNMLGEMATGLAHELNQPLAAINNYTQGCLRWLECGQFDTAHLAEAMRQISAQAQRAGRVIQQIRHLARKHEPERMPVDLKELVREAVALIEHEARRHQIRIQLALAAQPLVVQAAPVQIEQVVLNLLRNAIEAIDGTAGGRGQVLIETGKCGDQRAYLKVRDTGSGMTDEQLDHMFHPFYTSKPSGMGMGLNICQSIAEAHGGRLWAERNDDGAGMTFHLILPSDEADGR